MKTLLITILLMAPFYLGYSQDTTGTGLYIVINGRPASQQDLEKIRSDSTVVMHFLPSEKAVDLFGPVAAQGALMITTARSIKDFNPIILRNGRRISGDSVDYTDVTRIDVIRGRQAFSLYGPAGKDGVLILHSDKLQSADVILKLTDENGKPVRKATVFSENGSILAKSDKCGWVILENFSLGKTVNISAGKKRLNGLTVNRQIMNVKL